MTMPNLLVMRANSCLVQRKRFVRESEYIMRTPIESIAKSYIMSSAVYPSLVFLSLKYLVK